jgi:membrane protein DedA with SNARE-associated domain
MSSLESSVLNFIQHAYNLMQWPGVIALMAIESACIPIPSEIIMPLAGWILIKELSLPITFNLLAGVLGALGCTIGSIIAYWVGIKGGRPFLNKYGKYILITPHDLDRADQWFQKNGDWAIFIPDLHICRVFYLVHRTLFRRLFARRKLGENKNGDSSLRPGNHRFSCYPDWFLYLSAH